MTSTSAPSKRFHADDCRRFLRYIVDPAAGCTELRIFRADFAARGTYIVPADRFSKTIGGWYDDVEKLTFELMRLNGVSGYVTCNPVIRDLLSRLDNKLGAIDRGRGTNDNQVACLRWAFLDFDAERAADISATDAERALALDARDKFLGDHPEVLASSIWGSSGNGSWILARLPDYPNEPGSEALVKGFLARVGRGYGTNAVKVDPKTCNPSRVMGIAGTMKCKGSDRPERPWRLATIDSPEGHEPAPMDLGPWLSDHDDGFAEPAARSPVKSAGEKPSVNGTKVVQPSQTIPYSESLARHWVDFRAARYLKNVPPAISGEDGHKQTFKFSLDLVKGFDIPPEEGLPIAKAYNARCQPPWTEAELRRKLEEADQVEDRRPRGYLLALAEREMRQVGIPSLDGCIFDTDRPGGKRGDGQSSGGVAGAAGPKRPGGKPGRTFGTPEEEARRATLPSVVIATDEHRVADEAIAALAQDPEVYCRGSSLAEVIEYDSGSVKSIMRPPGSPRVSLMSRPRIRDVLTRSANFVTPKWDDEAKAWDEVPAHPPNWCVAAVEARGQWPGVRPILGVVETPILRPDGSALDSPGYDTATALFYRPNGSYPEIATNPTKEEAEKAAQELLELVQDFPFAAGHRAAWLSAALTPIARFAINGPVPLHYFDASTRGSGKSRLTDLVAVLATGRTMPRTGYQDDDAEMRKRITSIALAGDLMMLLDNVAEPFGGASLDAALTAMTWRDRVLGASQMTDEMPLFTCWHGSGNNTVFKGDIVRRVVLCRLESDLENPEERKDFSIEGDLIEHAKINRGRLVVAALTILKAHAQAGRPDCGLAPMGSFESWSRVVRSAVRWATGEDPCVGIKLVRDNDPETVGRAALIDSWAELPGADRGITTAEAIKLVRDHPASYGNLQAVLMEWSRTAELPSPRTVGMKLNGLRGRVIGGRRFASRDAGRGSLAWRVEVVQTDRCGTRGTSGTNYQPRRNQEMGGGVGEENGVGEEDIGRAGNSPNCPASPAPGGRETDPDDNPNHPFDPAAPENNPSFTW